MLAFHFVTRRILPSAVRTLSFPCSNYCRINHSCVPKQSFVTFELTPANEISGVDSFKKTLSKCCIETTPFLGNWKP